ncbi:thioredoxin-like protein [Atractiella rhizophila]|nr:thioredoxin-like protein [Atractiella rhizophila]
MLSTLLSLLFLSPTLSAPIPHAGLQLSASSFPQFPQPDSFVIEFYSPYCPHCRNYAPQWVELVGKDDILHAQGLKMAQVDCVANGDLCDQQKIKFYPTLRFYRKNGTIVEHSGNRSPDIFAPWILEQLAADIPAPIPLVSSPEEEQDELALSQDESEQHPDHSLTESKEDLEDSIFADHNSSNGDVPSPCIGDACAPTSSPSSSSNLDTASSEGHEGETAVAMSPTPTKEPALRLQTQPHRTRQIPNQSGEVVYTLSAEEFDMFIDPKEHRGPVFAAFKAPWCSHCRKLAPLWKELAERTKGVANILEVDCEADKNKKLCRREKVEGFPTLYLYNEGQKVEYKAKRKVDEFEKFVKKAIAATGVREIDTVDEFKQVLEEEEVMYLLVSPGGEQDQDALKTMQAAAKRLSIYQVLMFQTSSPEITQHLSISSPTILVFKSNSALPFAQLSLPASEYSLTTFLHRNRYPVLSELTSANFNGIMEAPEHPLVVITALSHARNTRREMEQKKKKLRGVVDKWLERTPADGERQTVWVWVDGDQWEKWLKSMYGMKNGMGTVVADHTVKAYWDEWSPKQTVKDVDEEKIIALVENVLSQSIQPKSSQTWIETITFELLHLMMTMMAFITSHPILSFFLFIAFCSFSFMLLKRSLDGPSRPSKRYSGSTGRTGVSDRDYWGGEKKTRVD